MKKILTFIAVLVLLALSLQAQETYNEQYYSTKLVEEDSVGHILNIEDYPTVISIKTEYEPQHYLFINSRKLAVSKAYQSEKGLLFECSDGSVLLVIKNANGIPVNAHFFNKGQWPARKYLLDFNIEDHSKKGF